MKETNDNRDKKFLNYFRNAFFVDKKALVKVFGEDDADVTYNFTNKKNNASKNIFEKICSAFAEEKHEELGAFFDKMNFMEKDTETFYNVSSQKTEELGLRDIANLINTENPYEFYDILNNNVDMFNKITLPKIPEYRKFVTDYEKNILDMKGKDIMEIQNFFSEASSMFNKSFMTEFIEDVRKSGKDSILEPYMNPFINFPEKILFGAGSAEDIADTVLKIEKDSRFHDMIKDKKDFKFAYDNTEKMMEREYRNTDFDKIDKIQDVAESFKISSFDSYVKALDFNMNDYLKEYKNVKPFLDRYNIKKMNRKNLKRLYEDRERLITKLENRNGMEFKDITKKFILNEEIVNRYMKSKLKGKPYLLIDNTASPFFGLRIPVINGKIDEELIDSEFDIFTQDVKKRIIKEGKELSNSRIRFVRQLIKTEKGLFDLNDAENTITNTVFNEIGIDYKKEIEESITDRQKIENILNETSSFCIFDNASYEFESRLDMALIKTIMPLIEYDHASKEKLFSYINKNSVILGNKYVYDNTFEELYKKIPKNSNFKIGKLDMYKLKQNKSYINKMLRENIPIKDIVNKYGFMDREHMIFILEVFKKSLEDPAVIKENKFNPVFRNSFFAERPSFENLKEKSNYIQGKVLEFFEKIKENQEKIDAFNRVNQEIFDDNFQNLIKNESRLNLINTMEKTDLNIEELKFLGQNPENIRKKNHIKEKIYSMQNKLTSTMAISILLRDKILEKKYQEILNFTDRFYVEIMKNTIKKNWQVLLRDYYTDRELLKNDIIINPELNVKLKRKIEYNLKLYNTSGVEDKVKILNNIMSNLDIKKLNKEFFKEELKKAAKIAKKMLEKKQNKLNSNNKKMHELLNKDIYMLKKMDTKTIKAVNEFADRFMERLENRCEDNEFADRFEKNKFFDSEFINYIIKYEDVSNEYIRDLLIIDDEGTVSETNYHNQGFQDKELSGNFSRYRESMKINILRKNSLIGKKIYENPEIKRLKNNRKKIDSEIADVKSKMKEILSETEREYEEDMKKNRYDKKEVLENQEKTRKKMTENTKITIQTIEIKEKEERTEAEREYEEDLQKIKENKEKEEEYIRSFI